MNFKNIDFLIRVALCDQQIESLAVFLKVDGQHVFANLSDPFQNKKKFS
jgi:hypothetical protein